VYKTAAEQFTMSTPKLTTTLERHESGRVRHMFVGRVGVLNRTTYSYRTATTAFRRSPAVKPPLPVHVTSLDGYRSARSNTGNTLTPYVTNVQEQRSVLIPYRDLLSVRAWLPEFTGTRIENPVQFLYNTELILKQVRIHPFGWCKTVDPQFKGVVSTWYNSIKILDLSWEKFRVEFLDHFDVLKIKFKLYDDMVSIQKTSKQLLEEFVLVKNQLARRVNNFLS